MRGPERRPEGVHSPFSVIVKDTGAAEPCLQNVGSKADAIIVLAMTIKLAPIGIPFDASAAVVLGIGNGIANFGLPPLPHIHAPLLPNFPSFFACPELGRCCGNVFIKFFAASFI